MIAQHPETPNGCQEVHHMLSDEPTVQYAAFSATFEAYILLQAARRSPDSNLVPGGQKWQRHLGRGSIRYSQTRSRIPDHGPHQQYHCQNTNFWGVVEQQLRRVLQHRKRGQLPGANWFKRLWAAAPGFQKHWKTLPTNLVQHLEEIHRDLNQIFLVPPLRLATWIQWVKLAGAISYRQDKHHSHRSFKEWIHSMLKSNTKALYQFSNRESSTATLVQEIHTGHGVLCTNHALMQHRVSFWTSFWGTRPPGPHPALRNLGRACREAVDEGLGPDPITRFQVVAAIENSKKRSAVGFDLWKPADW